jgi:hypothetical protein
MFQFAMQDRLEMAKAHQAMIVSEVRAARMAQRQVAETLKEQKALRRFQMMFRVRRWMHRWMPRVARVML